MTSEEKYGIGFMAIGKLAEDIVKHLPGWTVRMESRSPFGVVITSAAGQDMSVSFTRKSVKFYAMPPKEKIEYGFTHLIFDRELTGSRSLRSIDPALIAAKLAKACSKNHAKALARIQERIDAQKSVSAELRERARLHNKAGDYAAHLLSKMQILPSNIKFSAQPISGGDETPLLKLTITDLTADQLKEIIAVALKIKTESPAG